MASDIMMASGLTSLPVNEFVSRDVSVTCDSNKYDSFRNGGEKVKNSVNSLSEGVGGRL